MIEIQDVTQSYQNKIVLDGVDLHIHENELCALVGRNGAGKSTLIHSILGLLPLKKGSIRIHGTPVDKQAWKKNVAYLPEKFQLYPHLTGYENLQFFASVSDKKLDAGRMEETLKQVDLWEVRQQRIQEYSKGMLQRLGLGIMLYYDTRIIILDEPTSGLDPIGRMELLQLLKSLQNKTILLSSHHMDEIKQVCSHVAYIKDRKVTKYPIDQWNENYF
jgi:ABC-2 type transport system ATP-binding protein